MKLSTSLLWATPIVTAAIGYASFPLLNHNEPRSPYGTQTASGIVSQAMVSCEMSAEQIAHISGQLAPILAEKLAMTGIKEIAPNPSLAAKERVSAEQTKAEQTRSFAQASQMVDQMIANKQVTREGLSDAIRLLQQTGQSDRIIEINARIADAMNRGELTPAQAGHMLSAR